MKIEKILILVMIVSSLLGVSIYSVGAIEENETITDGVGDVVDSLGEVVDEHPDVDPENIDITELTYMREGKSVTLTLKVSGDIEDRGKIADLSGFFGLTDDLPNDMFEFDIDTVGYMFTLFTSHESYSVTYVNEECQVTYTSDFKTVNLSEKDFSVVGNTLTIFFEVNTTNETYESISVFTCYMKLKFSLSDLEGMDEDDLEDLMVILTDQAPNYPLEAYATVTNLGEVGKEVKFEGLVMFGQPPYEYQWEFGDGVTSPEETPTHIYDKAGDYTYTLTITDNSGSSESDTGTIEIADTSEDNDTPGFELVIVIVALGLILLWKRK